MIGKIHSSPNDPAITHTDGNSAGHGVCPAWKKASMRKYPAKEPMSPWNLLGEGVSIQLQRFSQVSRMKVLECQKTRRFGMRTCTDATS